MGYLEKNKALDGRELKLTNYKPKLNERSCRGRNRTFKEWLNRCWLSQILRHRDKEVCLPVSPPYSVKQSFLLLA